jgi:hypothetical protein
MKKKIVILLHLGYWAVYLLLLLVIFSLVQVQIKRTISFPAGLFLSPVGISCIIPNLVAFYGFYLLLFPRFLARRNIPALIVAGLLCCILSAFAGSLVLGILFGFDQPLFANSAEFSGLIVWMALVALIHGSIALVVRGFITWYGEIKLKEELRQKNFEMESALIKSRIDPHFLFNTLNNIDVLIETDAVRASAYLNKLSEIMRFMLYETGNGRIALEKELDYIEKYIELQKIRTSNARYVNFVVEEERGGLEIEPMIFIPFIENAFKHAGNKRVENAVDIRFATQKDTILFECSNNITVNSAEPEYGGLGNDLIRRRLELLYPGRYTLEIDKTVNKYSVKLVIDTK